MRCRPSTHKLVIAHAQCAWVSDQYALTMLHPLPTRAGDKTPFQQSGQVCAFLSPPRPHLLPHLCLPGRLHQQQCHTHRQARMWKQTHLNCRLRWRRQGRMLHGPTDASQCRRKFCWCHHVDQVRSRSPSQCPALLEQKCTPSLRPRAPARQLLRLYARVVVFLMCASLCHAHLAFCIDHYPSLHAVTSWS